MTTLHTHNCRRARARGREKIASVINGLIMAAVQKCGLLTRTSSDHLRLEAALIDTINDYTASRYQLAFRRSKVTVKRIW